MGYVRGMEPTAGEFKAAMRGFVGACSLITMGQGEAASGLVVTSGVSLTAEPPMVLACVNRGSSSWPVLKAEGCFGWSALGAGHEAVARRFSGASGIRGPARYEGSDWLTGVGGVRTLADAPLAFDCGVEEMIDRGTHSIVIGRVLAIRTLAGQGALVYWDGKYRGLVE